MSDIITGTPAELTYLHPFVRDAWTVVWAIASGALIVILGWMGFTFIVGEHLGSRTAGWPARSASAPDTCPCWSTRAAPLRDPSADGC